MVLVMTYDYGYSFGYSFGYGYGYGLNVFVYERVKNSINSSE